MEAVYFHTVLIACFQPMAQNSLFFPPHLINHGYFGNGRNCNTPNSSPVSEKMGSRFESPVLICMYIRKYECNSFKIVHLLFSFTAVYSIWSIKIFQVDLLVWIIPNAYWLVANLLHLFAHEVMKIERFNLLEKKWNYSKYIQISG